MSTRQPRRVDSKTASKRRAARRRQTRELLRRAGALVVVAILVLGTISSILVFQPKAAGTTADTTAVPTQAGPTGLDTLISQADTAAAKGDFVQATGLYRAYLGQNAENAEVHFKLGKAELSAPNPDYVDALAHLQRAQAISPNAAFAQEAKSLIDQNKAKADLTATVLGASGTVTGTSPVTATKIP